MHKDAITRKLQKNKKRFLCTGEETKHKFLFFVCKETTKKSTPFSQPQTIRKNVAKIGTHHNNKWRKEKTTVCATWKPGPVWINKIHHGEETTGQKQETTVSIWRNARQQFNKKGKKKKLSRNEKQNLSLAGLR